MLRGHGAAHCTCGASISGTSTPDDVIAKIVASFLEEHCTEDGHAPCDAATAAKVRRADHHDIVRAKVDLAGPRKAMDL